MKRIGSDYLVPMHCTGRDTINKFMAALPGKCILNTVGTTHVFGSQFFHKKRRFNLLIRCR